jgi:phosphatidylserine/phosphatidylglycerophosphate/cardiolipin synthase-like enzyme
VATSTLTASTSFVAAGFEIRSLRNLHAKVLLTDDRWGLIGSGNLTVAGANGGNAELGITLSAAQTQIARRDHFERWWEAGQPLDLKWMRTIKKHVGVRLSVVEERAAGDSLTAPRVLTYGPSGHRATGAAIGSRSSIRTKTA